MTSLQAIPVVDLRDGGPPRHARNSAPRARALRDACLGFLAARVLAAGAGARLGVARRWLARSRSPYIEEIGEIAAALDFSGVWLLNASYQWACTSLAVEHGGPPWLLRTLDWPFLGLGRHAEVAHMPGDRGDFYSVTWPGYVGALTAMAPFRFAACVNQAPMRRRTAHRWLRPLDFAANALDDLALAQTCMPPDQLLRRTFELCRGFRRRAAHAGNDAGGAAGDLHAGRAAPQASAASSSAPRPILSPATKRPARPTIGCRAGQAGRAGSEPGVS